MKTLGYYSLVQQQFKSLSLITRATCHKGNLINVCECPIQATSQN
jgi:hypothetical protein